MVSKEESEKIEDKCGGHKQNENNPMEDLSLDSTIWGECSMFQNIDLTALQLQPTPKSGVVFQSTDVFVVKDSPKPQNPNIVCPSPGEPLLVEPFSQFNCVDLNLDGDDPVVNEGEASNEGQYLNPKCGDESFQLLDPSLDENNPTKTIDVTHVFTTDEVFNSRDSLVDWAQRKGRGIKIVVVTRKSDQGTSTRKPRVLLGCERGGVYRDHRPLKVKRKKDSATKKCNCPFALRGSNSGLDQWKLTVKCGFHNHDLPNTLVGHPFAGRLTKEEKKFVYEMSVAGVKPKDILCGLKARNEANFSTMRTIYNVKANMRTHAMEGRSAMQQLMKILIERHYVYWHRCEESTDEVLDLFWAEPNCVLLAKRFPSVVIVDCTYKTNKYKMPLFAMVGITSTGKTFTIAHSFLYKELEDNYVWALSKLRMLFDAHELPSVFITDREFACINAIRQVFPDARRMLCMFHISKNVEQHCKKLFQSGSVWSLFIRDWSHCMMAKSKEEFFTRWGELKVDWKEFPKAVEYLASKCFGHREAFVVAWTNEIKHLGNRTTNRAEGSHGKLKRHLESGFGSFSTVFAGMANMLKLQLTEVEASFERSLGSLKLRHNGHNFKELRGNVSLFALDLIKNEKDKAIEIGLDAAVCDHVVRTVYGLPCAHELLQYGRANRPIPLEAIDEHWRRLTILPNIGNEADFFKTTEITLLNKLFDQSTEDEKKVILRKLKDLAMPYMASLKEPSPVIPKGRPSKRKLSQKAKKHESSTNRNPSGFEYAKTGDDQGQTRIPNNCSQVSKPNKQVAKKQKTKVDRTTNSEFKAYMQYIPTLMHPFITNLENVPSDGHCGFRSVAKQMGWHNDDQDWKIVRYDLLTDLGRHKDLYDAVWGSWFCIDNQARIDFFLPQADDPAHWMCMPDAGFLIASVYNCVVVFLSNTQSLTFFPHAEAPVEGSEVRVISIAHVYDNHFVSITLKDNSPLPIVASMWNVLRTPEAAAWEQLFADRLQFYKDGFLVVPRTKDSPIILN